MDTYNIQGYSRFILNDAPLPNPPESVYGMSGSLAIRPMSLRAPLIRLSTPCAGIRSTIISWLVLQWIRTYGCSIFGSQASRCMSSVDTIRR
eukprot:941562-Amorphochlora_amoeboformis.AAC.1